MLVHQRKAFHLADPKVRRDKRCGVLGWIATWSGFHLSAGQERTRKPSPYSSLTRTPPSPGGRGLTRVGKGPFPPGGGRSGWGEEVARVSPPPERSPSKGEGECCRTDVTTYRPPSGGRGGIIPSLMSPAVESMKGSAAGGVASTAAPWQARGCHAGGLVRRVSVPARAEASTGPAPGCSATGGRRTACGWPARVQASAPALTSLRRHTPLHK
jgi:hypothetical protein